ncbi:hypothetical protein IGI04_020725, partial [Brassica rapa subsp. trilocularis]
MANPWFPANSASALSPPLLTPGDRRFLAPPDPPDPDPDNPLSLARFPPLNSPSSLTSKSSKTSRTLLQSCSVTAPKSSSVPPTESFNGKTSTSAISDPVLPRSGNTVPNFDNFKILPPKTSSPIHTNRASNPLPKLPPPSEAPQNANHNPKTVPNPNHVPVFQVPPFTHVPLQTKPTNTESSSSSVPPEKSSAASYTPHKSSAASPTPHKPPSPLHEPPVSTPTCLPPAVTPLPLIVQPPKMSHPPPPNDPPSATVQPLSLFVSPTSPPEQPKKRPRPCSSQPFPSFTDQLNFFSLPKSPIRPPTPLPSISFQTSFGPNPFD